MRKHNKRREHEKKGLYEGKLNTMDLEERKKKKKKNCLYGRDNHLVPCPFLF